ncbi:hypothetical protein RND81_08G095900 [Saponaria officinalis]|uniref:Retrovirus-related Pol polyprotein from transposon TNT 1-94-like beta-barrel domain-containing protein n=1 Tax=Saponaria officinalis TaxID=3572 RepID=A0AAW1J5H5_SAPOF
MEEPMFMKISMAETSHETWDILQKSHKGDDRVKHIRLQTLREKFESLSMEDSESITEKSSYSEHALQSRANVTNHGGYHGGRGRGRGRERGGNNFSYRKNKNVDINFTGDHKRTSFVPERANVDEAKETLVLACKEGLHAESGNIWYLDTCCSNPMIGNKELFSYLDESVQGEVSFGNKSKVLVKGKGNINIPSKNGTNVTIEDVFYIPRIFWNLLSLVQLIEKGHKINIENGICEIKGKNNKLITKLLAQKNMVTGLPLIDTPDSLCEGCILRKHHRDSFPIGKSRRAMKPLKLVHIDICGPVEVESLGKRVEKNWVYFLKK